MNEHKKVVGNVVRETGTLLDFDLNEQQLESRVTMNK